MPLCVSLVNACAVLGSRRRGDWTGQSVTQPPPGGHPEREEAGVCARPDAHHAPGARPVVVSRADSPNAAQLQADETDTKSPR